MIAATDKTHAGWRAELMVDHTGGVVDLAVLDESDYGTTISLEFHEALRLAQRLVEAANVALALMPKLTEGEEG